MLAMNGEIVPASKTPIKINENVAVRVAFCFRAKTEPSAPKKPNSNASAGIPNHMPTRLIVPMLIANVPVAVDATGSTMFHPKDRIKKSTKNLPSANIELCQKEQNNSGIFILSFIFLEKNEVMGKVKKPKTQSKKAAFAAITTFSIF